MNISKLTVLLTGVLVTGSALAAGATSRPGLPNTVRHIEVEVNEGKAALNVVDATLSGNVANNKPTTFAKMEKMAKNPFVPAGFLSKDDNGVAVARLYRMTGFPWNIIPGMPDHSHLGRLSYAQAGDQDVWFGDWANVPSGAANGTAGSDYTVFYSGSNPTTNLPTSGTATYAVKGINNYVNKDDAVLTGTLTADFAGKTLNGSMAKSGLSIAINNATIHTNNATASFGGAAANDPVNAVANGNINGKVSGSFFGDQGAALAGIATFDGHNNLNTAFGGAKQ